MEYVAFDLEWNQPGSAEEFIKEPISFPGEIIQIGAVKLNEELEITDTFNAFINPVYYTKAYLKSSKERSVKKCIAIILSKQSLCWILSKRTKIK